VYIQVLFTLTPINLNPKGLLNSDVLSWHNIFRLSNATTSVSHKVRVGNSCFTSCAVLSESLQLNFIGRGNCWSHRGDHLNRDWPMYGSILFVD
jgi:hypothetical protein